MNGGAISWSSKKEQTVAKSSTEAEYMARSFAANEAIWLKGLNQELDFNGVNNMTIHCDNKGALDLTMNSNHHQKTKHIVIQYHFIRDCILKGEILFKGVVSKEMVADCLAKGLGGEANTHCAHAMGLSV